MTISYALREGVGYQYLLDLMEPYSPYGAERVRRPRWYGPAERAALMAQWDNVEAACAGLAAHADVYGRLGRLMMQLRDIRGTLRSMARTVLTEVDLFEVKRFALQVELILPLFESVGQAYKGIALAPSEPVLAVLDPEGRRAAGFALGGPHAKALAAIRERKRGVEAELRATPQGDGRDTLLNARRLLVAEEEKAMLDERERLTVALRPHAQALLGNAEALGQLDYTIQCAQLARSLGCVKPTLGEGGVRFGGMFNPQVEAALREKGRNFTRVDIDAPVGVAVITGANMGGKSVALRTLALNVLLCQTGLFAAAQTAQTMLFDAPHFLDEDAADTQAGLSSFGAEVLRLDGILRAVDGGAFCFVALDEPARGTNPREGAALVRALAERLSRARAVTVIATHYDGVARGAQRHYQAAGLREMPEDIPEGEGLAVLAAHMDYGLREVGRDAGAPREALAVMRLLRADEALTARMAALLQAEDA